MISFTTGTNVPRRASSLNSSNVVCFIRSASADRGRASPAASREQTGRAAAGRSRSRTAARPARRASPGRRSPGTRRAPPRASAPSGRGRRRGRRRAGRRRGRRTACRRDARALPTGVALTSRSQDPGGGGQARDRPRRSRARRSRAASGRRAEIATCAPSRRSASPTPRAAPPAPRITARTPARSGIRCRSGSRKPSASVFMPIHRPSRIAIVFTAPAAAAVGATSSSSGITSRLNGIVTLAPRRPIEPGELAEAVEIARLDRHVDRVQSERGKAGVVHRRRQRVGDRPAEQRVDRGVGADAPEAELLQQPRGRHLAGRDAVARIGPARAEPRRRGRASRGPRAPCRSGPTPSSGPRVLQQRCADRTRARP